MSETIKVKNRSKDLRVPGSYILNLYKFHIVFSNSTKCINNG